MKYTVFIQRNRLTGSYDGSPLRRWEADPLFEATLRNICGDLRRVEAHARDPHTIRDISCSTGVAEPGVVAVLAAFFAGA
jgi:hypothetical protein